MASDDSVESTIRRLLAALDSSGVPYMLTGSFASSFHGAPRTTQDIDVVIAPTLGALFNLLKEFPQDRYYVSRDAALQAFGSESLFNVIDMTSGWKIDFIVRKSRPFSLTEFERRLKADLLGTSLYVASAEDVIIAKLEWAKMSESERQLDDVAGIIRTQLGSLDLSYVDGWVASLALQTQWDTARNKAGLTTA
jgi:hypothetical protein